MKCDFLVFFKLPAKIQVSLKPDNNNWCFTKDLCTFIIIPLSILIKMRNVSENFAKKIQNTHFMFNNLSFGNTFRLRDTVEKYGEAGQAIYDNIILKIYYTYCFSTAIMVTLTRLSVTLYLSR